MKKLRVALLCPIVDDPTSWYRGLGPYDRLAQENGWQLTFPTALSWASLIGVDVLILQRPAAPEHFGVLMLAKNMGVKVIVDFDDDNLSVPKDNPTYPQYAPMHIKEALLNLARHCDVLQVTTKHMKDKYGIYNKNTVIIPNAIDDDLVKRRPLLPGSRENKFVWRGNLSQVRNLATVGQQIFNVSQQRPDYRFVFFGMDPYELTEKIPNHEVLPAVSLLDYFQVLPHIHGKALYYPLHQQDHSQARSHISWLEGTYANMAVVAYKNAEFTRPGCINFTTPQEFQDTLEAITRDEINIDTHVDQSWNEIQEKYILSKVNQKRLEVIQSLL